MSKPASPLAPAEAAASMPPLTGPSVTQKTGAAAANLAGTQSMPVWPEELLAVAEQQQLRHLLDPMLKATRAIFSGARWIKVYVEPDFQDPREKLIIFDVQIAGLVWPQSGDAHKAWSSEMLRLLPAQFIYTFVLLLDLVG